MDSGAVVSINPGLEIPMRELRFTTARSSGPGGQHVNKVETRVTLTFDVGASSSLNSEQKAQIREQLASRVTKAGVLRVTAQRHRSQAANRELVLERFAELLREALARDAPRRPTRVSPRAKRKRVAEKRRRGELKRLRSGDLDGER